jgi:hypothetical protein
MDAVQTDFQQANVRRFSILAAPILVVFIGHFAAQLFLALLGDWAWLGSSLVYWGSMILIIWLLGDKQSLSRWFAKSQGSKWWIVLALGMGLISFPLLLDRPVSPAVAILTSVRAVLRNPLTMALWGLIVAVGLVVGSIPVFFGLAIVVPVLGHSTWHLYRRVVSPAI